MSTTTVIARNILSNWSGFVFQVVITFFLTPYVVTGLGNTYYGIWSLVISLTGYYGLLDLGFSSGLTQYVARYYASKDFGRLNESVSTGFVILALVGAILLLASVGLAIVADRIFDIPPQARNEVRLSFLIVGAGAALQFLFFPYSAVFPATQRFDISNAIGIVTRIVFAISVYVLLDRGYGLVGVSIATTASNLIDYAARATISYRILPTLKISPSLAKVAHARELAHFGIWSVVIAGSVRLISYTSAVVIGLFLPPAAITPFALASNLSEYFIRLFIPIGYVFSPVFIERDTRGDEAGIRTLFLNGTRFLAVLALPFGLVAYWFSDAFFLLWIGEAAQSREYPSAAALFNVLIIASVLSAVQRVSYQVLLGTRRLKLLAGYFVVEGFMNLLMSVLLVRSFGLMGVAAATLIPAIVIEGLVFPYLVCRLYAIKVQDYVSGVLARPALITLLLCPILYAISLNLGPTTWSRLALDGVIASLAVCVLIVGLGISRAERERFVWRPIKRLGRGFS